MAWIETVPPERAEGALKRLYEEAVERAGRVYNVIRLQSLRPGVLRASVQLYSQIMKGESGLSRAEREMIAVVVSRANGCFY
jgi:uncharacterized peroxidase-related enzyme